MYLFKELVLNLPDNLKSYKFFVFNDTRIGDKTQEIKEIMEDLNHEIVTDKDTNNLLPVKTDFVYDYSMSLKMLMPWYLFSTTNYDKILFSDEDVLYTDKLHDVFSNIQTCSFARLRLQAASDKGMKPGKGRGYLSLMEVAKCCEYNYDPEEWYQKRINAGQFILTKEQFDVKLYEKILVAFFQNDFLFETWKNRRVHTSHFIDERFLAAFVIKSGIYNNDFEKHVLLCIGNETKIEDKYLINNYKKKALLHICNNSHKKKTYGRMIKLGLIKGEVVEG